MSSTNYNFVVCLHLRLKWSGSGLIVCPLGCTWKSHLKNRKVILILCKTRSNTQTPNYFQFDHCLSEPERNKVLLDLHYYISICNRKTKQIEINLVPLLFQIDLRSLTTMHDGSFLI